MPRQHLDEESFPQFGPLLAACQDYASHSRFGFRNSDFTELQHDLSSSDNCPEDDELAARLRAAAVVAHFSRHLNVAMWAASNDMATLEQQALMDELRWASRIVVSESVRKIMISTCTGLCMFPPTRSPAEVDSNDCFYEDVSSPLPVIAQRLYNEDRMRNSHTHGKLPWQRRAQTASFILDFAEEAGVAVPETPEAYQAVLAEFRERALEWQNQAVVACTSEEDEEAAQSSSDVELPVDLQLAEAFNKELQRTLHTWQRTLQTAATIVIAAAQRVMPAGQALHDNSENDKIIYEYAEKLDNVTISEYAEKLDMAWYEVTYHY